MGCAGPWAQTVLGTTYRTIGAIWRVMRWVTCWATHTRVARAPTKWLQSWANNPNLRVGVGQVRGRAPARAGDGGCEPAPPDFATRPGPADQNVFRGPFKGVGSRADFKFAV